MQSQSLLLGWDESESFLPGNVARPSSEGTHTRTHDLVSSLAPRIPSGRFVCRGLFLSLPPSPRPSRSPIPVSRLGHMARDEGYEREAGRKVMGREGRRWWVSVLPRVHGAARGPTVMQGYALALHKSQLRKVTCRRSLGDVVLCLNASKLLRLSKR